MQKYSGRKEETAGHLSTFIRGDDNTTTIEHNSYVDVGIIGIQVKIDEKYG